MKAPSLRDCEARIQAKRLILWRQNTIAEKFFVSLHQAITNFNLLVGIKYLLLL
jgi:hypothetical protein